MRILIIGGSGFLSGTIARVAHAAHHDVTIVTRGQRPAPPGVTMIVADRKDQAGFVRAIAAAKTSWDLVVDSIGFAGEDGQQDIDAFAGRCGHFVFVSTDFVYSPVQRPFPVDETFARFSDASYGAGKIAAEKLLLAAGAKLKTTILRPCHIYGPGSQLGCLPLHGRDPKLIDRLRIGEPLKLVGGGHFLQQPVYAPDLAEMILSCHGNEKAVGQIFNAPGPDVIESAEYYHIIAAVLGVKATIEEVSITEHLKAHPGHASFCCHRVYDRRRAIEAGLKVPATPIAVGLRHHVEAILQQPIRG
jgi:nucleoside-diphosphate-sugar epimerase